MLTMDLFGCCDCLRNDLDCLMAEDPLDAKANVLLDGCTAHNTDSTCTVLLSVQRPGGGPRVADLQIFCVSGTKVDPVGAP